MHGIWLFKLPLPSPAPSTEFTVWQSPSTVRVPVQDVNDVSVPVYNALPPTVVGECEVLHWTAAVRPLTRRFARSQGPQNDDQSERLEWTMNCLLLRTRLPSSSTIWYSPGSQPCCIALVGCMMGLVHTRLSKLI